MKVEVHNGKCPKCGPTKIRIELTDENQITNIQCDNCGYSDIKLEIYDENPDLSPKIIVNGNYIIEAIKKGKNILLNEGDKQIILQSIIKANYKTIYYIGKDKFIFIPLEKD